MAKSVVQNGFRGGVIYAAADVSPTTVQSWGVDIGERHGTGHKRYDAIDAIMLGIMQSITAEAGFPAGRAATLLNKNRLAIRAAIGAHLTEQSKAKRWRWEGGPFILIRPRSSRFLGSDDSLSIATVEDLRNLFADGREATPQIVLSLPVTINRVMMRLGTVLEGNLAASTDE
ncbi:hypothetical protein [Sphingomonas sp. IW22]|uniref:hypothetical protein n=1 Tax=Sphingomonas sp. IW22 TaxID=3242489 RepID=UPI00352261C2